MSAKCMAHSLIIKVRYQFTKLQNMCSKNYIQLTSLISEWNYKFCITVPGWKLIILILKKCPSYKGWNQSGVCKPMEKRIQLKMRFPDSPTDGVSYYTLAICKFLVDAKLITWSFNLSLFPLGSDNCHHHCMIKPNWFRKQCSSSSRYLR